MKKKINIFNKKTTIIFSIFLLLLFLIVYNNYESFTIGGSSNLKNTNTIETLQRKIARRQRDLQSYGGSLAYRAAMATGAARSLEELERAKTELENQEKNNPLYTSLQTEYLLDELEEGTRMREGGGIARAGLRLAGFRPIRQIRADLEESMASNRLMNNIMYPPTMPPPSPERKRPESPKPPPLPVWRAEPDISEPVVMTRQVSQQQRRLPRPRTPDRPHGITRPVAQQQRTLPRTRTPDRPHGITRPFAQQQRTLPRPRTPDRPHGITRPFAQQQRRLPRPRTP